MKNKLLFFLFGVAFLVRFIALNQSLWLDEATTAQTIKHFSYLQLITKFAPTDFHPPLYYLFMKAWDSFFGYSEVSLRMPSVLFSLLTGWFVYLIGKKLKDNKTGIWASAFFLFNPLIVYYSQEARMYLMVTFFLTVVLYLFLDVIPSEAKRSRGIFHNPTSVVNEIPRLQHSSLGMTLIFLNIFIALSLFTFYGSVFFIAGLYAYLIIKVLFMDPRVKPEDDDETASNNKNTKLLIQMLPGFVIAMLMLSPLLLKQYSHAKQMLGLVPHWSLVLGKANAKNLFLIPLKFSIGRIQFEPKIAYYLGAGAWTMFVFGYVTIGSMKRKVLGILFIVPLFLGFIFSFFTPLLQYFRFLYLIPLLSLLLVSGLTAHIKRGLYLTVFILLSFIYLLLPQFHRENWKDLAVVLPKNTPVYMVYSSSDPLSYYLSQQKKSNVKILDLNELKNINSKQKTIIVVPYTSDIFGIPYKQILTDKKFTQRIQFNLRGVSLERWDRK